MENLKQLEFEKEVVFEGHTYKLDIIISPDESFSDLENVQVHIYEAIGIKIPYFFVYEVKKATSENDRYFNAVLDAFQSFKARNDIQEMINWDGDLDQVVSNEDKLIKVLSELNKINSTLDTYMKKNRY